MSDRLTQSYSDGRTEKSMHSVQSVWMARWTRTSYNATAETHCHAPNAHKENDRVSKPHQSIVELETMSKLSKSVKRLRESETQTFEVVKQSLRTSSRTIAKETLGCRSLSLHIPCENIKTTFQDPPDSVKTQSYVSDRSIVASRPLLDKPSGLGSNFVPYPDAGHYITREGEKMLTPFISRSSLSAKEEVPRLRMLEPEHHNSHNYSASLVSEEKVNNHLERGKFMSPYLTQNNTFLLDVPSTSRKLPLEFGGEDFKKVPGSSFARLSKNESRSSLVSESKELHPRSYNQRKLLHPLHDVEKMRISNTMDPVMGLAGYYPLTSQTNHSLLIAKRPDANICNGDKVTGKRLWSDYNGKATLSGHDSASKSFGHRKGVKLQLLDCSTGSEGKENIEESKTSKDVLKNESSVETDTMDLDVFQEKSQLCGISSSTVKKVDKLDHNSPPQLALDCSRKKSGCKRFDLNIHLELPAPTDNLEPTSSKTESLDLESILAHAERPSSSRANLHPEGLLGQNPSSRWLKRLKVRASGSLGVGTKSSSFIGESSHEIAHKFVSRVTKATITSSHSTPSKLLGNDLTSHDNTPGSAMNSSPSSTSLIKKDQELLTSHSWIQRLLHDRATTTQKTSEPVVVCEPHSSKLELDDFQKKQLPSLGAMALMGKAMNGFQPCEFHKRGPLVVWNTRSF